jgi:regulator of sirC expression with transglutaminase-like and TPR domain
MGLPSPVHCRRVAWDAMEECLDRLETGGGLLAGALAIAAHADPAVSPQRVESELAGITARIADRLVGDDPRAILAHAHAVLFDELGFAGDVEEYYDPRNSFVQRVLERRRGLPITLTLIYKLVLEALGLSVTGVNTPGHFVARVEAQRGLRPMLVDPFAKGRVLSVAELVARVRAIAGGTFAVDPERLPIATHREWLLRMLRNLIGIHHARNEEGERAAMEELSRLVRSTP